MDTSQQVGSQSTSRADPLTTEIHTLVRDTRRRGDDGGASGGLTNHELRHRQWVNSHSFEDQPTRYGNLQQDYNQLAKPTTRKSLQELLALEFERKLSLLIEPTSSGHQSTRLGDRERSTSQADNNHSSCSTDLGWPSRTLDLASDRDNHELASGTVVRRAGASPSSLLVANRSTPVTGLRVPDWLGAPTSSRPVVLDIRNGVARSGQEASKLAPQDSRPSDRNTSGQTPASIQKQQTVSDSGPNKVEESIKFVDSEENLKGSEIQDKSRKNSKTKQEKDRNSKPESQVKGTRPPSFGGTPLKIARLPYFSYFGRARNVELKSPADRTVSTNKVPDNKSPTAAESPSSIVSGSSSGLSIAASSGSSASSTSAPLGSARKRSYSSSRIPTLTRTSSSVVDVEFDGDAIEQRQRERHQQRIRGYSNISNLFPGRPMNVRDYGRNLDRVAGSGASSKFSNARDTGGSLANLGARNLNQQAGPLASKLQQRARSNDRTGRFASGSANTIDRGYTTGRSQSGGSISRNSRYNSRSLYSLSPTASEPNRTSTMRRQNSGSMSHLPTSKQPRAPMYQGRQSAQPEVGYYGQDGQRQQQPAAYGRSFQRRPPSTGSLLYGSAGMNSPYDPDCPVHGFETSPTGLDPYDQGDELADEPYERYYDRPMGAGPRALYSPPLTRRTGGRPASEAAYYNGASRFSLAYQDGNGRTSSSLAPPAEQLRRILGYTPREAPISKPVHLHPQWAYTRPFVHLLGTRSMSPTDGADSETEAERPRFAPFSQLQDAQPIRAVDFHPSGQVYAVGSNSRALRICAYPADHELRHFEPKVGAPESPRVLFKFLQVHRGSIYCVRFNQAGQLLATGSNDQTVHIVRYNSVTHSPDGDEYRLSMHNGTIRDLCFIDDSRSASSILLSAGGGDNKIYVTDCDTITPFQSMAGHTQMVMALDHVAGATFVSASHDRTIRFWDLRTRECTSIVSAPTKWAGPGAPVCAVASDPSGRLLVSGHTDATCMLYDIRGAKPIQTFKPHRDETRTVSFSPKSYYLLTGGYDGRLVLTDLQGDLTQSLPTVCVAECADKIVQTKWHPTDFTFVATSADKSATLWAVPTD